VLQLLNLWAVILSNLNAAPIQNSLFAGIFRPEKLQMRQDCVARADFVVDFALAYRLLRFHLSLLIDAKSGWEV